MRWTHQAGSTTPTCYTDSGWDTSVCPDGETCARNNSVGAVPEADWEGTYGINQESNGVNIGFIIQGPSSFNAGSRSYMMENDQEYNSSNMLQKKISFDVDVSNMPRGTDSAIYFSKMEKTGNAGPMNMADAAFGTGYCDGQCAHVGWILNKADRYDNNRTGDMGACC